MAGSMTMPTSEARPAEPGPALQFWSVVLPVLKCALCPACLSILGGIFAGARLGFVGSERFHGALLAAALLADLFILRAAMKHHQSRWPLAMCLCGSAVALMGHLFAEPLEYVGFALLMGAAVQNVILLRRHRTHRGACCEHDARLHRSPAHERSVHDAPAPGYQRSAQ